MVLLNQCSHRTVSKQQIYMSTTKASPFSVTDFLNWKSQIEDGIIQYFKRASSVNIKNGQKVTKTYYICKYSSPNKVKKSNKTCPSRIILSHTEVDDKHDVTYHSTHLGHDSIPNKLKKSERQILANRIKNGDNLNDVLEDARNIKQCNSKLNDLNKIDIHNIIRDFHIDKNIVNYGQSRTKKVNIDDRGLVEVQEDNTEIESLVSNIDNANMKTIYVLNLNKTE